MRAIQKALANDITIRVHGEEALQTAIKTSEFLFGNGSLAFLQGQSAAQVLSVFEGLPHFTLSKQMLSAGIPIIELLASHTSIFPSKAEAKKMLQGGGVAINKEKIESEEMLVANEHLINKEFIVIQKGKKNYFLIQLVD